LKPDLTVSKKFILIASVVNKKNIPNKLVEEKWKKDLTKHKIECFMDLMTSTNSQQDLACCKTLGKLHSKDD
jgi:hypothetical protein